MFDYSRVLTTGADSMIGSYVDFGTRAGRATLDVLNAAMVMRFVMELRPSAIIHLAAATDTARCESDPAYAFALNAGGTLNVACAARAVGARMVYVSTSRVFSGDKVGPYTESDIPAPSTVYGQSKLLGETITASVVPEHLIVRTCWVFGGGPTRDTKFYGSVLMQLKSGVKEIVALNDGYGSPTYGADVVAAIKDLLARNERGTVHVAGAPAARRADIARCMVDALGLHTEVHEVGQGHFNLAYPLPANESVVSERVQLRPWQEALKHYIANEW